MLNVQPATAQESLAGEALRWLAALDYERLVDSSGRTQIPVIERFEWDGRPIDPGYRRVRVIARQAYVLCQAALAQNAIAAPLAARVMDALFAHAVGADGQFVSRLSPDGDAIDQTPDLYDIAFGLFATAWWYRLSGDTRALAVAERSVDHIRVVMRSPSGSGYIARAGQPINHCQNPHMHLFEAALMLSQFSGRETFAALADELFELAVNRMVDPVSGTLAETFDADWQPLVSAGGDCAIWIEPGHHYEWVWLLHRYGAQASRPAAFAMAARLYDFATRTGHDRTTALVVDAVSRDGTVIGADLRIWPNAEFLKAQVAMREHYGAAPGYADDDVASNATRIVHHYLTPPLDGPARTLCQGLWIDYLHADAVTPKCDHVPASSLYHIVFAFSELVRHSMTKVPQGLHRQAQSASGPLIDVGKHRVMARQR